MKLRHAAKALIRRRSDGKYLMLWASEWIGNPRRSHMPDLPGGIVEEGESMVEGLLREIHEEAGMTIPVNDLVLAHAHVWDEVEENASTVFEVYFVEIEDAHVTLSWEHERYEWLTAAELQAIDIRQPYHMIFEHMAKIELIV